MVLLLTTNEWKMSKLEAFTDFIDFILARWLVRYHPLLVSALVPSQNFILSISLIFPSPLVVILSNSPQPMSVMQSTLLPLGRLKQRYKSQKHSNISPTNLSLPRQCADTSGKLVWRQWWRRKSPFCHKSIGSREWTFQSGINIGLWGTGKG